jgi:hypothetical protein
MILNSLHTIGLLLVAASLPIIILNWLCILVNLFFGEHGSWFPLPGLVASVGCLLGPAQFRSCWWVFLVIDWGTIPGLSLALVAWLHAARRGKGSGHGERRD